MYKDILAELEGNVKPQSLRKSYFELGRSLLYSSEWEKAQQYFLCALQEQDNAIEDWRIFSLLYFVNQQQNQVSAARKYLLQAIGAAPPDISRQLSKDAVSLPEDSIPHADGFDSLLLLQGEAEVYRGQHKFDKAKEKMAAALQIILERKDEVMESSARLSFANILYESGDFAAAKEHLALIRSQGDIPETSAAKLLKGKCLLAEQQYTEPLEIANLLISLNNGIDGYILRLQCFLYQSDYNQALETVHNAFLIYPSADELLFYKMQILVESNLDSEEALEVFGQLKLNRGEEFIVEKLQEPYLRFRSHHGNDNFFLAQVYYWMPHKFSPAQAVEEADKAINEGVVFRDNDYPQGIVYRLKAVIYETSKDFTKAAEFYSSAGKEFYWNRQYAVADELFKKAIELNSSQIEAYRYYADNQLLLSFLPEYPYVNKKRLDESFAIWQKAYDKQLPVVQDAWTYLTLARILEQQSLLGGVNKVKNYQSAWLAVEKNLLLSGQGYFAMSCLSRILREMDGLEKCAFAAAKKAEELSPENVNVWESLSAISLNIGLWDDGLAALQKLRKVYPDDATYIGWEGFAYYGKKDFAKAVEVFNVALEKDQSWGWARLMRIICNWFLGKTTLMMPDIEYLLSREATYLENKSYWEISFAHFVSNNPQKAYEILESAPAIKEFEKNNHFYQCIYCVAMDNIKLANNHLEKYLKLTKVERDISELQTFLDTVRPGKNLFKERLEEVLIEIKKDLIATPARELQVLEDSSPEYKQPEKDAWLALHLANFRIMLDERNWVKAGQEAEKVNSNRKDYVDAGLMYDKFLLGLQAWLYNVLESGENFEQWQLIRAALEATRQSFISLPDTWFIASLLAANRGKKDLAVEFDQRAKSLYTQISQDDTEKNIRRLQDTYPAISEHLSKEDSASVSKMVVCKKCGVLITTPKQRFCINCGENLYSTTTATS